MLQKQWDEGFWCLRCNYGFHMIDTCRHEPVSCGKCGKDHDTNLHEYALEIEAKGRNYKNSRKAPAKNISNPQ